MSEQLDDEYAMLDLDVTNANVKKYFNWLTHNILSYLEFNFY